MLQTLGQRRVKAEFNPDKNEIVDIIKNKSAELIDLINAYINDEAVAPGNEMYASFNESEKVRVARIAQQYIETGCMYAVKANFTK
jgi:hypothetical protein